MPSPSSTIEACEAAHTPGPWIADVHFAVRYSARSYVPVLRPGNDPVPVAAVHIDADGYGRDEGLANARLIAAAPDMLAALKATRIYVETLEKHLDPVTDPGAPTIREHGAMLRAAIAKAEGRT